MKRKYYVTIAGLLIALFLVIPQAYAAGGEKYIRMVAGGTGGSWYPLGVAMMDIVEKNIPGISASSSPGGGVANCKTIHRGQADLGWTYSHTASNAFNGTGTFNKKHDKLRHLMSFFPGILQIAVPKKRDIKTIGDLWNKRIVPGKVGFTGTKIMEIVLKAYDITFESIKKNGGIVNYVGYNDAAALMKDGHNDCYVAVTTSPHAVLIDLNFKPGVRLLGIDEAHMKKVLELEPGLMPTVIQKADYKGMTEDIHTIGTVSEVIVSADMPDQIAYQIVKVVYDNYDQLAKVKKKSIANSPPENALMGARIPVHPGAMRYYREKGIKLK